MNKFAIFGVGISLFILSELFLIFSMILFSTNISTISFILLISCSILFPIAFISSLLRPNLNHLRNAKGIYTDDANAFLIFVINKIERFIRDKVEENVQLTGNKLILKHDVEEFCNKSFEDILND